MSYLLDTAVFLWMAFDETRHFSVKVKKILSNKENELYLSVVSAWEIIIKYSLGKLSMEEPPSQWILQAIPKMGLKPLEVTLEHVLKISELHDHHKDPFDRLLLGQSISNNLPLISPDTILKKYDAKVIW